MGRMVEENLLTREKIDKIYMYSIKKKPYGDCTVILQDGTKVRGELYSLD